MFARRKQTAADAPAEGRSEAPPPGKPRRKLRLPIKQCTGLLLSDEEVVLTTLVPSPRGPRVKLRHSEPVFGGDVASALEALIEQGHLSPRDRIVCGLDPRRAFSVTRVLSDEEWARTPTELLAATFGCGEDAIVASRDQVKLPSGQYAVMSSCPRPRAAGFLKGLHVDKRSRVRLLPVGWALHQRVARARGKARRWKTQVRVLVGDGNGLAILVSGGVPLASRLFEMPKVGAAQMIGLAVLSLSTYAIETLRLPRVDGVVLHAGDGGADLCAEAETVCGLTMLPGPSQSCNAAACSEALAWAAWRGQGHQLDMFRDLRPPPGLRENFPMRAAALVLTVLLGGAWLLWSEASDLEAEAAKLEKVAEANAKKAKAKLTDVPKLHEKYEGEVGIAAAFLADRVFWSDVFKALPDVVPDTMTLTDFDAKDGIKWPSKKKKGQAAAEVIRRKLAVTGEVALGREDSSPPEVEQLTDALRGDSYFRREFPRITGATVRLLPAVKGLAARIMIVCLPPKDGSG